MSRKVDISIVIVTHRRPELCRRSLLSVRAAAGKCPFMKWEILVGVNGRDAETRSLLAQLKEEFSSDLLLNPMETFFFDSPSPPGECRNRLLAGAQGEWIYFLDDDAYLDEGFFLKWEECRLKSDCAAVGGPNLNPPHSNFFQKAASQVLSSPFATYFSSSRYHPHGGPRFCSEASLILCHLFVRREVLSEKPFLKDLVCAEENWLLQDLTERGFRLGYDPELFVWHERRPDLKTFIRQVFKYGYGRGQIFRRRFSGLKLFHLLPSLCLLYTFCLIVFLVFGKSVSWGWFFPFPVYAILCLYFAVKGPAEPKAWGRKLFSALIFPVVHVCYGWGLWCGFFA